MGKKDKQLIRHELAAENESKKRHRVNYHILQQTVVIQYKGCVWQNISKRFPIFETSLLLPGPM